MGAAPILTILKDGETIRSVPIEGDAVLGRGEGCVIRLQDRKISRQHAIFRRKGAEVLVEKKSEFAPLLVNGADCTQAVLKAGDVIEIGPYLLKLEQSAQQAASGNPDVSPAPGIESSPPAIEAVESEPLAFESPVVEEAGELPALETPAEEAPADGLALQAPDESPSPLEQPLETGGEAPVVGDGMAEMDLAPIQGESEASPGSELPALTLENPEPFSDEGEKTRVVAQAMPELKLIFNPGEANVAEYRLTKPETSIGRGKDCDVILNDKKASRKNCVIVRDGLVCTIRDLGSSNGTYVNGEKISERELMGGDRVRIGDVQFQFRADQPGYEEQAQDFLSVPAVTEETGPVELPPFEGMFSSDRVAEPMDQEMAPQYMPAEQVMVPGVDPMADDPHLSLAGINGGNSGKPKSLVEKFRALPKRRQAIWAAVILAVIWFGVLDDGNDGAPPAQKHKVVQVHKNGSPGLPKKTTRPFSALTKDQQDFVRTQHKLAFEYFQNKDFNNALEAIRPIFQYVDDYQDSREIEKYAEEGVRRLKILAEEKEKKEQEEEKARRLTKLIDQTRDLMDHKKYDAASSLFNEILVIDPENAQVAQWQAKIRDHEEDLQMEAKRKEVQSEVNRAAWDLYKKGTWLHGKGRLREAIEKFSKVHALGASDRRPERLAARQIKAIHAEIQAKVNPLLQDGRSKEDNQDFTGAMKDYRAALRVEPGLPAAEAGIQRVRGVLIERAKVLYTEAVLAESYSDFATAKAKFKECLKTAPIDNIYHDRAERKLAKYLDLNDGSAPGP